MRSLRLKKSNYSVTQRHTEKNEYFHENLCELHENSVILCVPANALSSCKKKLMTVHFGGNGYSQVLHPIAFFQNHINHDPDANEIGHQSHHHKRDAIIG